MDLRQYEKQLKALRSPTCSRTQKTRLYKGGHHHPEKPTVLNQLTFMVLRVENQRLLQRQTGYYLSQEPHWH